MKRTTGDRGPGGRRFTLRHPAGEAGDSGRAVQNRHGRQQRFGIRMSRIAEQTIGWAGFHDPAPKYMTYTRRHA